jgi:hypothetical protein
VVTHPLGYSDATDTGAATNSMLIAGLSSMAQFRGPVAQQFAPDGSYAYFAGSTYGQYYYAGYYGPPPTFLQEWTRSLFYLPSADNHSSTVIVFDRVNAQDPQTLPNFDRYAPADQALIQAAPALKQWVINAPANPTVTASGLSWTTAGGEDVSVSTLLPLQETRTVYSDSTLFGNNPSILASEKTGYQVRISPATTEQYDLFLNVVQASDPGTVLKNTLVTSAGGEAQGTLVQRGGLPDTLVMFGAEEAQRVLSAGYTATYTAGSSTSTVYLLDLDPSKTWTVRVDGGPATRVSVSSQGVAQLSVTGAGSHTFQLIAS